MYLISLPQMMSAFQNMHYREYQTFKLTLQFISMEIVQISYLLHDTTSLLYNKALQSKYCIRKYVVSLINSILQEHNKVFFVFSKKCIFQMGVVALRPRYG